MNAIIQKQHQYMIQEDVEENERDDEKDLNVLCESMIKHSKQECALEILNRLKYYFKKIMFV